MGTVSEKSMIEALKKEFVGKKWSVWWDTNDGRPGGDHLATILDVLPYTGRYNFIACVFVLSAPNNNSGQTKMSIEHNSIERARYITKSLE